MGNEFPGGNLLSNVLVRLIFRTIFERKGSKATEQSDALIEG